MRKGFLEIDYRLVNKGGLDEVAEMKRNSPPVKSPLMKILTESVNPGAATKEADGEESLQLDTIGCTANVLMCDFKAKKLFMANAGDSRSVMGKGGKCVALSFDHKPEC